VERTPSCIHADFDRCKEDMDSGRESAPALMAANELANIPLFVYV